jgi:PKD repeat protein
VVTGNSASQYGGGAFSATLNNCTLTGNSAGAAGGGADYGTLNNCILYYNTAPIGANYTNGTLNYCCTTPLPSAGTSNRVDEPQLASAWRLSAGSPCRGAGSTSYARGVDIDGEPWVNPPAIGCDEYWSGSLTGNLSVAILAPAGYVTAGVAADLQAVIGGRASTLRWDFGDGVAATNQPYASHAWAAGGDYTVELRAFNETYPAGVAATVTVHVVDHPIHYVSLSSVAPAPPYSSWSTAATGIQDAVDAAAPGALVLVSNGVYHTGARAVYGMSNRLAVSKAVTVQSVNGPEVTAIAGYGPNGPNAVRCVYLTNGAVLVGFSLTNGATQTGNSSYYNQSGGGVWCESASAVVSNCTLSGNSAAAYGGGAYSATLNDCMVMGNSANSGGGASFGTLNRCTLTNNSAGSGGGAYSSMLNNCALTVNSASDSGGGAASATLNNCMLTGNSASVYGGGASGCTLNNCTLTGNSATGSYCSGGGAYSATLRNCIVYYNTALSSANCDSDSTLNYCCTTPLPSGGAGNITAEPQLASASHLSAGSPCRGAGSAAYTSGTDIDGEPWANPPSIGCDEYWSGSVTGAVSVAIVASYTTVAPGFAVDFEALIGGRVSGSRWDFGDGVAVSNQLWTSHAWLTAGDYGVELRAYNESYPAGVSASVTVHVPAQPVHYVSLSSPAPAPPFTNWATAARNIQDAVDVATMPGALVLVSNGVYEVGAQEVYGMSNRVAVTKPVRVQSLNGPGVTSVVGYQVPGTTNDDAAVRCVYLTNGAVLSGFTLTNGATQAVDDSDPQNSGGAAWCESLGAVLTNCVLAGNSAYENGGGAYSGTLYDCTLTGNSAEYGSGGGACYSTLNNCTLTGNSAEWYAGGGAYSSTLNNCTLTNNWAGDGGGAFLGTLNNCVLADNWASAAGGVESATLNNCTLTGNSASDYAGGAYDSTFNNCIVYYNSASSGLGDNYYAGSLNYCCTTPLPPTGTSNITAEPQLVSVSHLSAWSPCRGAGSAAYASGTDIDGEPWANPPSIGCDEYWSGSVTGGLSVAIMTSYTNLAAGLALDLKAIIGGRVTGSRWDFGDGTVVSNALYASHIWLAPGDYTVELRAFNETYPEGVADAVTIHVTPQATLYVSLNSTNPVSPYTTWATAATNIQDAVDAATRGDLVLVSNGVYQTGARAVYGMSNRVAVTKPLTVQSVNGSGVTTIAGYGPNGDVAVRCVYLTNGAVLAGFTLTSGATQTSGDFNRQGSGGGVWCESESGVVRNCVLTGNSAYFYGGGAYYGTFNDCTLTGNSVAWDAGEGGGAYYGTLNHCTLTGNSVTGNVGSGGGASGGTLNHCVLTGNTATGNQAEGGGAFCSALNYCTLTGNAANGQQGDGGGAAGGTLNDCTLTHNTATWFGGGTYGGTLNNCMLIANSASQAGGGTRSGTLSNCTLTGNSAYAGGGAYMGTLYNCTLTGNSASEYGGGVYSGWLNSCVLSGNSAYYGGGAMGDVYFGAGWLTNCTITGNSAQYGGGACYIGPLRNCLIYFNDAPNGANYYTADMEYYCTTPLPEEGVGNITAEPQLASASHLSAGSPCRGAGSAAYTSGTDIDGEPWANPPSIGCDEYWGGSVTGAVSVAVVASSTNVTVGFVVNFQALIEGRLSASRWDFGDGVVVSNQPYASHAWAAPGEYAVELRAYNETYPAGVATSVTVHVDQGFYYVALTSTNPVAPYSSWATAATNIQDAVDAAALGALVWVSNGVYQAGARAVNGMSNRVVVAKPVAVRSVNGPGVTTIAGHGPTGPAAVRCVYLANGAALAGFTLTNGATQLIYGYDVGYGGGVWCESASAVVSNCVLTANSAFESGGGANGGTLKNCVLTGNSASYGGGASSATLYNCTLTSNTATFGGGTDSATLRNCVLTANSASWQGGGANSATLYNCTLTGNWAEWYGGGAYASTLYNCTLTGNWAEWYGGGAYASTLYNCIAYYNTAPIGNYDSSSTLNYCCTTPLPTGGVGNTNAEPQLASASHLSAGSPCRSAGGTSYAAGEDIDGEPWGGPPAIGCDEYWSGSVTGALSVAIVASYTNVAAGFAVDFQALIGGRVSASQWDYGDGAVVSNRPYASHSWAAAGDYVVELRAFNESVPGGLATNVAVHVAAQPVHYVALSSPAPASPYTNWTTAARNIQAAVDAATLPGALVLVTNGIYQTGGRSGSGTGIRVAVSKPVRVQSVNGPLALIPTHGTRPNIFPIGPV